MEEKDVYFNVLFGNIYIYKIKTDLIYISFELKHKTDQFLFPQHTKQTFFVSFKRLLQLFNA